MLRSSLIIINVPLLLLHAVFRCRLLSLFHTNGQSKTRRRVKPETTTTTITTEKEEKKQWADFKQKINAFVFCLHNVPLPFFIIPAWSLPLTIFVFVLSLLLVFFACFFFLFLYTHQNLTAIIMWILLRLANNNAIHNRWGSLGMNVFFVLYLG